MPRPAKECSLVRSCKETSARGLTVEIQIRVQIAEFSNGRCSWDQLLCPVTGEPGRDSQSNRQRTRPYRTKYIGSVIHEFTNLSGITASSGYLKLLSRYPTGRVVGQCVVAEKIQYYVFVARIFQTTLGWGL